MSLFPGGVPMAMRVLTAAALLLAVTAGLSAADPTDKDIQTAIKGGRYYLQACYKPGGPGPGGFAGDNPAAAILPGLIGGGAMQTGPAALAGLALLEAGVPAGDPAVANITRMARDAAYAAGSTYEISLLIMFLDRLGARQDTPLIQLLTLRLLTGQLSDGSWSYTCDGLKLDEVQSRLIRQEIQRDSRLVSGDAAARPVPKAGPRQDLDAPPTPKKDPTPGPKEEPKKDDSAGLHPAVRKLARGSLNAVHVAPGSSGDHSNTQFATVGLWVGRRHSVDVTAALTRLDEHYRRCQAPDGGWAYTAAGGGSTPAMTCAGLMGLAIGFGAKNLPDGATKAPRIADPETLNKDQKVMAGLRFVGDFLAAAGQMRDPRAGGFQPNELTSNLYFMWSLERVGVVYGLDTIGKVNWYDWGSSVLVRTQQRDGSWTADGFHSGGTDSATAFALLFLCRANLTEDLSRGLQGKVTDPGTSKLVGVKGGLDGLLEGPARSTGSAASRRSDSGGTTRPPSQPRGDLLPPRTDKPAPKAPATTDKDPLAEALIAAGPADRPDLIAKYRDTKGIQYTDALARAAARLTGDAQTQVRDALAERLTRMTPATLVGQMADPDRELRRAAAMAGASKGKERLPELADGLIKLIGDQESMVVQAARATLKTLTGQDFGPEAANSAADRAQAQAAWRKWWAEQKK